MSQSSEAPRRANAELWQAHERDTPLAQHRARLQCRDGWEGRWSEARLRLTGADRPIPDVTLAPLGRWVTGTAPETPTGGV